jgi:hypothetical protein
VKAELNQIVGSMVVELSQNKWSPAAINKYASREMKRNLSLKAFDQVVPPSFKGYGNVLQYGQIINFARYTHPKENERAILSFLLEFQNNKGNMDGFIVELVKENGKWLILDFPDSVPH